MSNTVPAFSPSESRSESDQRRRLLKVAKVVSATLGREFFQSLVEHLAKALAMECAYVAEVTTGPVARLRSLAVYRDGAPAADFQQDLPGSCANQVLVDGSVAWSKGASRVFPADRALDRDSVEGYVGVRLSDSAGQVIGLIAVYGSRPIRSVSLAKSVLETFASRAAAELERKRAEDLLREAEQRYRAFISSSLDAMWRIEFDRPIPLSLPEEEQLASIYRNGYLAECNAAMSRMVGARSPDELVGTQFSALFPPSDERLRAELWLAVRSRYRSATIQTAPVDRHGRTQYRLRTQCGIVENDELHRIWGVTRDITELKRAELAVEAAERRFREVLEHIRTPVLMLEPDGVVAFCNDSLLRLARSSRDDLIGTNWFDWIADPGEREVWKALLAGGSGDDEPNFHFERVLRLNGAEPRLLVWDATRLEDEDGRPAGLAAIGRDVTAERALEAQLSHARRLDSIGRLAAGISHDFNNLLTLIIGHVAMVLEEIDPKLEFYHTLLTVKYAADECAVLTQQLLEIGRGQRLRPEVMSLNALVAEEQATLRAMAGSGVDVTADLDPSAGYVCADPGQIRRILANLVTNARDAMPEGGTVTIATFNVEIGKPPGPNSADLPPGSYVALTVADTGIGLTDEVRAQMFDPFFTTKNRGKGTGLGLATVYGIVTQSGGYVSASGEPGKGTTMEILLPRAEPPPEDGENTPAR